MHMRGVLGGMYLWVFLACCLVGGVDEDPCDESARVLLLHGERVCAEAIPRMGNVWAHSCSSVDDVLASADVQALPI